tara:strand:+ start:105 stop:614 length:510 start_codon:yes stop_codon:yes gene_type:complete
MYNSESIQEEILTWMKDFVEKPNPLLKNWAPCPYARQARIADKIKIYWSDQSDIQNVISTSLMQLEDNDAVIIAFDHNLIDPRELADKVNDWNKNWLMPLDFVLLEDHPDTIEHVNGVHMNFGKCGLIIVQRLSELNQASEKLKEKGYYDTWSEDDLNFVVNWRYHERK